MFVLLCLDQRSCSTPSPVSTGMGDLFKFNSQCRQFILVCNYPLRSSQPDQPFVGHQNEYQLKDGSNREKTAERKSKHICLNCDQSICVYFKHDNRTFVTIFGSDKTYTKKPTLMMMMMMIHE